MQTPQTSSFLSCVKLRWQNSWFTERVELPALASGGAMDACQGEKTKRNLALVGIFGLLVGQTILPGAMLISNVQAEELRIEDRKQAERKARDANTPAWAKAVERRVAQEKRDREQYLLATASNEKTSGARASLTQGKRGGKGGDDNGFGRPPLRSVPGSKPGAVVESEPLDCLDCDTDVRALDLSRVPTEKELRRAGQLGGALNPLRSSNPEELGLKLDKLVKSAGVEGGLKAQLPPKDPRERGLQRAKEKYARAQAINLDFGKAIQEWNRHNYSKAAKMLEKHVKDYPESPWAGEAELHLGCDAKYNGRFAEAQQIYQNLIDKTSSQPNPKLDKKRKERKARGGAPAIQELNADVAQAAQGAASLEAAVVKLDATREDDESFQIHQKAKLRWADLDLAMGRFADASEKMTDILKTDTDWRRRTWARTWIRTSNFYQKRAPQLMACGPQALGLVLASLDKNAAADKVREAVAPRAQGFSLAELKTLAAKNGVKMRGFKAKTGELASLPLPAILHYDFSTNAKEQGAKASDERGTASPFRATGGGHFVVLQRVDAKKGEVHLFDPLEKRPYRMTFAQLERQWSGQGLALEAAAPKGAKTRMARAELDAGAMQEAVGGCCGVPSTEDDQGDSPNNEDCKPCGTSSGGGAVSPIRKGPDSIHSGAIMKRPSDGGEPVVSFNMATINMYVHDTPLWYSPPIGPGVGITMSYNSQDATTQHQPFGNKWMFNYGSYAVEDTAANGGRITVFMPDGSKDNYVPNGNGGYTSEVGNFSRLEKQTATRYVLIGQENDRWIYDVPAGTTSLQSFLVRMEDPWGKGLNFSYNANVNLTTITDAGGKVSTLVYDADNRITRVFDPFGRKASFSYDVNGNLVEAVDMEGHAFQYTYDADVRITQINTAQGPWNFKHEGPDGSYAPYYPAPNSAMWDNVRVTASNPAGAKEEYYYDGYYARSWRVDHNAYQEYPGNSNPRYGAAPNRTEYKFVVIGGSGRISQIAYPDGTTNSFGYNAALDMVNSVTDARGLTTTMTHNALGYVTSVTDPKSHTSSVSYAANGIDVTSATNANGVQVMSATYNSHHQPLSVTDSSGTSTFSYTAWGAPLMSVDPQNKASRLVYDAAGRVASMQRADAPTGATWETLGGFTYDEVGRVQTATDTTVTPNLTMGYRYNNLDEIVQVLYPDGTSETTDYVCCGLPGVVTDRSGRKSYYDYDVLKRLTRVQDAQGNTLQMDYDKNGNLVRLVDSKGQLTKWLYDGMNRAVEKKYHDGTTEAYSYAQGLLSQSKGARGQIVSYAYDNNANLTGINYPNMPDVTMSYNALDNMTQIVDGVGTHSFTYDNIGKLLSLDGPFANDEQIFGYDSLQRLSDQSVQRGASGGVQSQSYAYDALGRLATLNSNGTQGVGAFTYNYVGLTSLLSSLDMPNGTQTVQSYDALHRLTQVANKKTGGSDLNRFTYAYDNRNMRTGMQQKYGSDPLRQVAYSYDAVDQLVGEAATGGTAGTTYSNAYSYDAMSNRLKRENTQGMTTALTRSGVNELNQLTSVSTSVDGGPRVTGGMSYDAAGNLTETAGLNGARTLYVYDDADRLFRIEKRDANDARLSKSEFVYDYASRKAVSQEFTYMAGAWVKNSEKRRVFDGLDVIQERDENNQVTAQLVRDGNVAGILSRSTAAGASFYGYDGGGNVTLLTDASGNEVGRYRYDAFGNTLEIAGTRAAENPYRFSTMELHVHSGLYDYGFRFYSASLGRWINRDPLSERGGLNLYAMVRNNPVNTIDVYGLLPDLILHDDDTATAVPPPGLLDNSPMYASGHIIVDATPGRNAKSADIKLALRTIFSTRTGQKMLSDMKKLNVTIWIYQKSVPGRVSPASTFTSVLNRSCAGKRTAVIYIDVNRRVLTDITGLPRSGNTELPFDVILTHEMGHAIYQYSDLGAAPGFNVTKVENPYRQDRRRQGGGIWLGDYSPRMRYSPSTKPEFKNR